MGLQCQEGFAFFGLARQVFTTDGSPDPLEYCGPVLGTNYLEVAWCIPQNDSAVLKKGDNVFS